MNKEETNLLNNLRSKRWRLNNLYWIIDKEGKKVKFKLNWAQEILYNCMWYLCIILKARQIGFTTFVCIFSLDECIFESNFSVGIVAHNREDAESFFDKKVKYPYDNLPETIRKMCPAESDTVRTLKFKNNSSIRVGTSMRSGTLNILHVSEFGKICAKYPEKAKEIVTGAFNTVQAGQRLFIESTAEGAAGYFFDYCQLAMELDRRRTPLTLLDFKFFFFPWWKHPEYVLDPEHVTISSELKRYFTELKQIGITLTREQKAWYSKKYGIQKDDMKREFPSTPEEAFEAQIEGCFFGGDLKKHRAQKNIQGTFGRLTNDKHGHATIEEDPNGIVEVWRWPHNLTSPDDLPWINRYVLGCDIGEGLGQDYSVAYVYDRIRKEFVARMRSNKIDSVEWAGLLIKLAWFYKSCTEKQDDKGHGKVHQTIIPEMSLIVPERTGAGITTCKILSDRLANVYNHTEVAKDGKVVTKKVGWVETKQAKFDLAGDLREYFASTAGRVYDHILLNECAVFIQEESNLGAAEGFHDDCVIAAGLALQGHYFLGDKPRQIKPPLQGWKKKYKDENKTSWAV